MEMFKIRSTATPAAPGGNRLRSRRLAAAGGALVASAGLWAFAAGPARAAQPTTAASSTNLLTNGSFDQGYPVETATCHQVFGNNPDNWEPVAYTPTPAPQGVSCPADTIPGWTVAGGGVDWTSTVSYGQPAFDGDTSIDLNGEEPNPAGTISQTVATTPGAAYSLTYEYASNAACELGVKSGSVTAGSASQTFTVDDSNGFAGWQQGTLNFSAAGDSTTVTFSSLEPTLNCGPAIDAVSLVEVLPTTAAQCKNGGWMAFGVFKNQGDCVSYVATNGRNAAG